MPPRPHPPVEPTAPVEPHRLVHPHPPVEPTPLSTAFYRRDALDVAPDVLGKLLCRRLLDGTVLAHAITEVEVYRGEQDSACHARAGRTRRTAVMYRPGGIAYVYLCYGIHHLLNLVTGPEGMPQAVLVRGLEPARGPGRLTKLMGVDLTLNGAPLDGSAGLWLADAVRPPPAVQRGPRVGIGYATPEDQALPWRFTAVWRTATSRQL